MHGPVIGYLPLVVWYSLAKTHNSEYHLFYIVMKCLRLPILLVKYISKTNAYISTLEWLGIIMLFEIIGITQYLLK